MEKRECPIDWLTEREREVLVLIAKGLTSKEIGVNLGISSKTASAHRDNIKKKLRADSIAQLVQCAIVHGLITPYCALIAEADENAQET